MIKKYIMRHMQFMLVSLVIYCCCFFFFWKHSLDQSCRAQKGEHLFLSEWNWWLLLAGCSPCRGETEAETRCVWCVCVWSVCLWPRLEKLAVLHKCLQSCDWRDWWTCQKWKPGATSSESCGYSIISNTVFRLSWCDLGVILLMAGE